MSAAIDEPARSRVLQRDEPRPHRVVERSLNVAGHDRVPFPLTWRPSVSRLDETVDRSRSSSSRRRSPLAAARTGARDDPRGVRRQERPLRDDARRPRHVRLPPRSPVGVHAAALRLVLPDPLLPVGRSWLAVGIAQVVVAVATALVVFEIGSRLRSTGVGLVAALIATLHPYVVWHDVHLNREVLDGLLLAVLVLCALAAYERRSLSRSAATGAVAGWRSSATRLRPPPARARPLCRLADRSGSRTVTSSALVVGVRRSSSRRGSRGTRSRSAATRSRPTRERSGRRTTRTRATSSTRRLDRRRARLPGAPPRPELAADLTLAGTADVGGRVRADAPLPRRGRRLLARGARREGAPRGQATRMLWSPVPRESDDERERSVAGSRARRSSPRS